MKVLRILFSLITVYLSSLSFSVLNENEEIRQVAELPALFGTQTLPEATINPIVRLTTLDGRGFCTAWIVDANYAVTAAHCINKNGKLPSVKYTFTDRNGVNTNIIVTASAFDVRTDLGLLTGDFNTFKQQKVDFYNEGFYSDHKYIMCGYPLGQSRLSCTTFEVKGYNYFHVKGNGHLIPGMSGGPVIDLNTGYAVGVNYAVTEDSSLVSPIQGMLGMFGIE